MLWNKEMSLPLSTSDEKEVKGDGLHTDRYDIHLSRLIIKNYSTSSRVPVGVLGLPKLDIFVKILSILGRFRSSKSYKL